MFEKHKGRKRSKGLNPLETAVRSRDSDILAMVERALRHKEVMLAYQPVVVTDDPRRIAFYEGLIRVLDETGRVIPARDFMPVAEATDMGRIIDRIALEFGLLELCRNPQLRLSINLSAKSLHDPKWHKVLHHGLARDGTVGERLILEITEESVMTRPEQVLDIMDDIQLKGVAFALDDFGAGRTAIRYFKDFAFDILKIDGSLIRGIDTSPDNQAIVRALMSIGRHFDMFTIAEHVETKEQADCLRALGVDCLQGYFFGAPSLRPAWHQSRTRKRLA
ncbi:EAL domain-containing protein [Donghicola eburneus]|uniref:EAL domain-containing protein n=1 Tax=Donghicola eburneus TaxID=393278 RepID=A0A1M4N4F2_9RHOB|nr:EAL domain-containing protein [Donghicola eburneus]SCM68884.1 hypothetical protein KARMA_3114 [Donghicola eburneus]SFQ39958.1 EAL domain, c-di-GMP-specific phosphodiesterase class I (or its enzymatically inactive variant) [Donghicola eburneus]